MTLIVENGSGLPNAESYISVADATTYHANRGNTAWALLSTPQMEQVLRQGADYMVQVFRERWAGWRLTSTQALDWPRFEVPMKDAPAGYGANPAYYPQNVVPGGVANANAEYALRAAAAALAPDLQQGLKSEKIGVIETEYDTDTPQEPRYPAVERMLQPFLRIGAGTIALVRA